VNHEVNYWLVNFIMTLYMEIYVIRSMTYVYKLKP